MNSRARVWREHKENQYRRMVELNRKMADLGMDRCVEQCRERILIARLAYFLFQMKGYGA